MLTQKGGKMSDLISRQAAIEHFIALWECIDEIMDKEEWEDVCKTTANEIPSAQPERLTDDDFETIRIHLNAHKEKLCNQQRWEEAEEYQRIIDRFMAFASAQPDRASCQQVTGKLDLISRQAAIDTMEQWLYDGKDNRTVREVVYELPSAQPDHASCQQVTGKLDLIKRQDAIDAVSKYGFDFPQYMERFVTELRDAMKADLKHDIKALPSAPLYTPDEIQTMQDLEWAQMEKMYELGKEERKKGKWIERECGTEEKAEGWQTVIVCSRCDFPATTFYSEDCERRTQIRTHYCPNCGADMRGNGNEERTSD